MKRALASAVFCLGLVAAPLDGQAASGTAAVAHLTVPQAAAFSKQVERELAGRGARVAMVFRSGRPRADLPPGLGYTHGAFWVYQTIQAEDGRTLQGYAVYNLYQGDGETRPVTRSYLAQDFPLDFIRGSAIDEVAVIVPTPEMQRRLMGLIGGQTYAGLHNPSYSLIANPLATKHQNCNSFMLDVVAAAAWETSDPRQIRANLAAHFKPSPIKVGALTRAFGPLADPRLKTDDQGPGLVTAAYESMAAFMAQNQLSQGAFTIFRKP